MGCFKPSVIFSPDPLAPELADTTTRRRLRVTATEAQVLAKFDGSQTAKELALWAANEGLAVGPLQLQVMLERLERAGFLASAPHVPPQDARDVGFAPADDPLTLAHIVPSMRNDLKIVLNPGSRSTYQISDPQAHRSFTLYDFEVSIARMLDGRRNAGQVLEASAKIGIAVTLDSLRRFLLQLKAYKFLSSEPADLTRRAQHSTWPMRVEWTEDLRQLFQSALKSLRSGRLHEAREYVLAMLEIDPMNKEGQETKARVEDLQREPVVELTFAELHGEHASSTGAVLDSQKRISVALPPTEPLELIPAPMPMPPMPVGARPTAPAPVAPPVVTEPEPVVAAPVMVDLLVDEPPAEPPVAAPPAEPEPAADAPILGVPVPRPSPAPPMLFAAAPSPEPKVDPEPPPPEAVVHAIEMPGPPPQFDESPVVEAPAPMLAMIDDVPAAPAPAPMTEPVPSAPEPPRVEVSGIADVSDVVAPAAAPSPTPVPESADDAPRPKGRWRRVLILLLLAGIAGLLAVPVPQSKTIAAELAPIELATVAVPRAGTVEASPVHEGQVVQKGELLGTLSTKGTAAELERLHVKAAALEKQLEQVAKTVKPAEVEKARVALAAKNKELALATEAKHRAELKHAGAAAIARAEKDVQAKQAATDKANEQLEKVSQDSKLGTGRQVLEGLKRESAQLEAEVAEARIVAPEAGRIEGLPAAGATLAEHAVFAKLFAPETLSVVASAPGFSSDVEPAAVTLGGTPVTGLHWTKDGAAPRLAGTVAANGLKPGPATLNVSLGKRSWGLELYERVAPMLQSLKKQ